MEYVIKKNRKNKHLKLSISNTGKILVTAPLIINNAIIQDFVTQHREWIEKQLEKIKSVNKIWHKDDSLILFGKEYIIRLWRPRSRPRYRLTSDSLWLTQDEINDFSNCVPKIINDELKEKFVKRIKEINKNNFGFSYNNLTIRSQNSRWGSYSTSGTLSFNWRLALAPPEIIDYVIIHELSHIKHQNHSIDFWNFVAKFDPEYKKHRNWLKQNGYRLTL